MSVDKMELESNPAAIVDDSADPLIPGGRALRDFTKSLVRRRADLAEARETAVAAVGAAGAARAATVAANFEMMNRLLDAGGVPIPTNKWDEASALGLDVDEIKARHPRLR